MSDSGTKSRLLRSSAFVALCAAGSLGLFAGQALATTQTPGTQSSTQSSSTNSTSNQGANTKGAEPSSQQSGQNTKSPLPGQGPVSLHVSVSNQDLLNAWRNPDNWMLYGRDYSNERFSPLTQINASDVRRLAPVGIIQTGVANTFEDNPIEVDGVLYIATADDHVQAYDATNGRELWSYSPSLHYSSLCCGPESRGVAVAYGKVFLATLDARVIALNADTGKVEWQASPVKDMKNSTDYSFTMAPQVYDNMVIVGASGAEYPTRDFVEAFNANTGKEVWKFDTTAAPGQPGGKSWSGDSYKTGGGSVWNTPAIDVRDGLVLFGTGNPNPDNWGEDRKGNNAYCNSIVALHAKDGKIAWWYQEVHHDLWDYDADAPVVLLEAMDHGHMVPAAAEAGKEGNAFIVNLQNGQLIRESQAFVQQSKTMWTVPSSKAVTIFPGAQGGNEWSPEAYSPITHDLYIDGTNQAWVYKGAAPHAEVASNSKSAGAGTTSIGLRLGSEMNAVTGTHPATTIPPTGNISAIDVNDGRVMWQYHSDMPMVGGAMATAGNLVFSGEMNGNFDAFDARNGHRLWSFYLGSGVDAPPITYRVNGVQYVAVAAGGNAANSNPTLNGEVGKHFGDTVAIFALPRG